MEENSFMRKEIIGIVLFFLVIFTLISLLSYSPQDPSINNARATGEIQNLFGRFGAHVAGALIALFGVGAFWLPILLLLLSVQFSGETPEAVLYQRIVGGLLLIVTTGSLIAFYSNNLNSDELWDRVDWQQTREAMKRNWEE